MRATSNSRSPITLVLASSSPRRKELIATLGLPVRVRPSLADETVPGDWSPDKIVRELSLRKARAVADAETEAEGDNGAGTKSIVIGSDTIVALDGEIMGKPSDESEALAMLTRLSGRTHEVYTGVTCMEPRTNKVATSYRMTKVRMRPLAEERLARYVATGEPMDKAGAYGIQGMGSLLVDGIEGCYFTVVGLPLSLLAEMLESFGVDLP